MFSFLFDTLTVPLVFGLSTRERQDNRKGMMNMPSLTSSFTKVCIYDRPHEHWTVALSFQNSCKRLMNIMSVKSLCYGSISLRPSTRRRENIVLKNMHFGKHFSMNAIRVTYNAVYMWTQGVNVQDSMRLQM